MGTNSDNFLDRHDREALECPSDGGLNEMSDLGSIFTFSTDVETRGFGVLGKQESIPHDVGSSSTASDNKLPLPVANLDWAVMTLKGEFMRPNRVKINENNALGVELHCASSPRPLPSYDINALAITSRGLQRGRLSQAMSSLMMAPERVFVKTLDFLPRPSSCKYSFSQASIIQLIQLSIC